MVDFAVPADLLPAAPARPLPPPNVIPTARARVRWEVPGVVGSAFVLRMLDNGICLADIPGRGLGTHVWRNVFRAELSLRAWGYVRTALGKKWSSARVKAVRVAFRESVAALAGPGGTLGEGGGVS